MRWQGAIDASQVLPDLYIVQISIGSQGIINGMWNPDHAKCLIPGPLGCVNISLYHFAKVVFPLVRKNLEADGGTSEVIGWHWLGSEQDFSAVTSGNTEVTSRYDHFFHDMIAFIGCDCPTYLYKLCCKQWCEAYNTPVSSMEFINEEFVRLCRQHKNFQIVDLSLSPLWRENQIDLGVFCSDLIHYRAATQKWFADQFFEQIVKRFS